MKKSTIAVAVAAVVLGYPASSWFLGRLVHSTLEAEYAKLANSPIIQVKERTLESGVFSSVEVVTFEVMPGITDALNKAMQKRKESTITLDEEGEVAAGDATESAEAPPAEPAKPAEPLRFTIRTEFKHGPLPGFAGFGAASAHSELVLDQPRHPMIAKLYGDKAPLVIDTVFGFGGGGHQVVVSPAVDTTTEDQSKVSWGEARIELDFSSGMAEYSMTGGVPFFKAQSADGTDIIAATALTLEGKQKKLFADDDLTYTGPMKLVLDKLDVTTSKGFAFSAEKLAFDSDSSGQGDFMDAKVGYGVQKLTVGPEVIGPSQLDIGVRHIHARSISEINKEYMKIAQDPAFFSQETPDLSKFKVMAKPLQTILENSPELGIDKLELSLPQGKVTGQVVLRLPNAKVGDLSLAAENPLVLMGLASAVEVEGKLSVPEVLMQTAGENANAMLPAMVGEGYIVQENGMLSTNFKYATGQLVVNGKNVDLGKMGAGGR